MSEYLLELCLRSLLIMLTGLLYFSLLMGAGGGAPETGPRPLLVLALSPSSLPASPGEPHASSLVIWTSESAESPSVTVGMLVVKLLDWAAEEKMERQF